MACFKSLKQMPNSQRDSLTAARLSAPAGGVYVRFCLDYQLAVGHAEHQIALLSWDS